jgi:hypothetical protein
MHGGRPHRNHPLRITRNSGVSRVGGLRVLVIVDGLNDEIFTIQGLIADQLHLH